MKILFASVFFCVGLTHICFSQKGEKKYINPDITGIYSTHEERPFRYGFPYTRDEILKEYKEHYEAFGIQSGDVVADIGAASGWLDGVFSVFSEEVTYYVQDIDTNLLNTVQLDAVVKHFSSQRQTPQSNSFKMVIGDETGTNLPDATFDLIIINNTFHEFSDFGNMVQDIEKKLKPGGRLVIWESFANPEMKVRHKGCNIKSMLVSEVEELFSPVGLYLTKMAYPEYSVLNYLTFERDQNKSLAYKGELEKIAPQLATLNELTSKKTYKDWRELDRVRDNLWDDMPAITEVYPDVAEFFFGLADRFSEHKIGRAIEVMNTSLELFPDDLESMILLGDLYSEIELYEEALGHYYGALSLDSSDMYARASAVFCQTGMLNYEDAFYEYFAGLEHDSTDAYLFYAAGSLCQNIVNSEEVPFNVQLGAQDDYKEIEMDQDELLLFALELMGKAVQYGSQEPLYYVSRAGIYESLGDYEHAIKDYDYAIYLNPFDLVNYRYRAKAKLALGDEEGSEADLALMKSVRKGMRN